MRFILEWDWMRPCISPDWSLTAWAEAGALTITHMAGFVSQKLPFISFKEIVPVDPMQELINNYTMNFPYTSPVGFCGFRFLQELDRTVNMFKIVAVHNCMNFGVDLSISFRQGEW